MEEKKYYALVTDIGAAVLSNAPLAGEKVNITELAVGDGGEAYYRPTADMIRLKGEKWRGKIASYKKDPLSDNIVVVKTIVPYNVGGFTIREMGLFDDKGNLITIENLPEMEKVKSESGASFDLEITSRIIVSNTEALNIVFDPTTVIATKRNIEEHNKAGNAHGNRFMALDAHTGNTDIHVTAEQTENYNVAISGLIAHTEEQEAHTNEQEKTGWNIGAQTAAQAQTSASQANIKANQLESRVARLEDGLFSNINGNPFLVAFDSLSGIILTRGVWNRAQQRIEC